MFIIRIVSLAVWFSIAAVFPALAADNTPLNVKPGLWEITSDSQSSGAPPIPPEVLAQMSPDQRAKLEAVMQHAMGPQHRVAKRCVTQADIKTGFEKLENMGNGSCTHKVISSTSTLRAGSFTCTGRENTAGTYRFEARNPEMVVGNMDMTLSNSGKIMETKVATSARWLGADCGSVKPMQ